MVFAVREGRVREKRGRGRVRPPRTESFARSLDLAVLDEARRETSLIVARVVVVVRGGHNHRSAEHGDQRGGRAPLGERDAVHERGDHVRERRRVASSAHEARAVHGAQDGAEHAHGCPRAGYQAQALPRARRAKRRMRRARGVRDGLEERQAHHVHERAVWFREDQGVHPRRERLLRRVADVHVHALGHGHQRQLREHRPHIFVVTGGCRRIARQHLGEVPLLSTHEPARVPAHSHRRRRESAHREAIHRARHPGDHHVAGARPLARKRATISITRSRAVGTSFPPTLELAERR